MFGNQKALQRCYDALKFIGVFLERRKRTASPVRRNRIVPHLGNLKGKVGGVAGEWPQWINGFQTYTSNWQYAKTIIWYLVMNALYLCCCLYIYTTRDYSDRSMTGIFINAWMVIAPTMVIFILFRCNFSHRSFVKLFKVIAEIFYAENFHVERAIYSPDVWLAVCLTGTRLTVLYLAVTSVIALEDSFSTEGFRLLFDYFIYYVFMLLCFGLIYSYRFFIGVLTKRFIESSDFLAKFGTSYGSFGTLTEEYVVNEIYVTAISTSKRGKPLTIAEKILKDIENQMVLIDQALELLEDTYSWVLIAMSIWYLTDLLFAFYMVMTNFGSNGVSNPTMSFVVIVEGMSILFLIHNPADTLLEAEEDFLVHLRMFICHVPDEELSRPNTGLVLAVQRPRSLTLGKFGTIGRSSFLNTLAFMMSYVVTTIQFYYAAPPAAPTPHVGFINATDLSPPPMTNSSNYTA
ncbi:Gustatory receptor 137 [Hyalella azteca]|uniref:Gustatory receptor 137 n=1 Tax=Hyalella azteca TaxID=294128 RepID=A0A6A0H4A0_HYAAZ|nr:Gustatory receptor 137 [Hyalella azteca]